MKIIQAFKTSKGVFSTFTEANKHRAKEYGSRPGETDFENVIKIHLLEDEGKYFILKECEVVR